MAATRLLKHRLHERAADERGAGRVWAELLRVEVEGPLPGLVGLLARPVYPDPAHHPERLPLQLQEPEPEAGAETPDVDLLLLTLATVALCYLPLRFLNG